MQTTALPDDEDVLATQPAGLPRPLVDSSVVKQVTGLMGQDSALMQQAKTAGLQQANSRGLLNSSMAIGTAQDSAYRAALPIAGQEAAQRAARNAQSIDIANRERMQGRDIASQQLMQGRQFDFAGTQAGLDRSLQTALQASQITAQQQAQIRDIASREGLAAADFALRELMQQRDITATAENQIRDITSRFGLQAADAASLLERLGLEIASREGMQADEIEFRNLAMMEEIAARYGLQENDIAATMERMEADIAARAATQEREIEYQTSERALDRGLQEMLASWNLSSSDRNAAATMLSQMESMYQSMYQSIMVNTELDATTRSQQLTSAQNLRNAQIDFVQQLYDVQLQWPQ